MRFRAQARHAECTASATLEPHVVTERLQPLLPQDKLRFLKDDWQEKWESSNYFL